MEESNPPDLNAGERSTVHVGMYMYIVRIHILTPVLHVHMYDLYSQKICTIHSSPVQLWISLSQVTKSLTSVLLRLLFHSSPVSRAGMR